MCVLLKNQAIYFAIRAKITTFEDEFCMVLPTGTINRSLNY
jgi:hypothetical protein